VLERLRELPGVDSVTLADSVPLSLDTHSSIVGPDGYVPRPHEDLEIGRAFVGPDYLRTMRIPLTAGRDFTTRDTRDSERVAVVNQAFVDRYWSGRDAVGRRIRLGEQWCVVVGVTRNFRWETPGDTPRPFLLLPLLQNYYPAVTLHVRTTGDPHRYRSAVERTVRAMNPSMPLFEATTLRERTRAATFLGRIAATVVGAFGLLALLLAAIGIYGVVSYSAGQRTREIGIRTALGASQGVITRLVLSHGTRLTLAGLFVGTAGSLVLTRLLRHQLFGVSPVDPPTFAVVVVTMGLVALAACYIPARRASRANPLASLR
jgi:predicted permease